MSDKLLLKVSKAAELYDVSRGALYNAINRGEFPVIRIGRSVRIPKVWLEKWINEQVQKWEEARRNG